MNKKTILAVGLPLLVICIFSLLRPSEKKQIHDYLQENNNTFVEDGEMFGARLSKSTIYGYYYAEDQQIISTTDPKVAVDVADQLIKEGIRYQYLVHPGKLTMMWKHKSYLPKVKDNENPSI